MQIVYPVPSVLSSHVSAKSAKVMAVNCFIFLLLLPYIKISGDYHPTFMLISGSKAPILILKFRNRKRRCLYVYVDKMEL